MGAGGAWVGGGGRGVQGEVGSEMFIIDFGKIEILAPSWSSSSEFVPGDRLHELGPGEFFGEIAVRHAARPALVGSRIDELQAHGMPPSLIARKCTCEHLQHRSPHDHSPIWCVRACVLGAAVAHT